MTAPATYTDEFGYPHCGDCGRYRLHKPSRKPDVRPGELCRCVPYPTPIAEVIARVGA